MNFIKELNKQLESKHVTPYRNFKSIECGNFKLSIQGSDGHYCSPRETLMPDEYQEMEVAIFDSENNWVYTDNSAVKLFPRFNELLERADGEPSEGSGSQVFGYVPMDLIEDFYNFLTEQKFQISE